jgi:hypothetical protein
MNMKTKIVLPVFLCIIILLGLKTRAQNIFPSNVTVTNWLVTGNAGTTPGTNFLGTTDAKALMFKVNNSQAGYLDYAAAKANTAFGFKSLLVNKGSENAAMGHYALFSNTTGYRNTAMGDSALVLNKTGFDNSSYGAYSMQDNVNGNSNTAIGYSTLIHNISGSSNTAIGAGALYYDTASNNTAIGVYSLFYNTAGTKNTANGYEALYNNTTGNNNTSTGYTSLLTNTTGYDNTANGVEALYWNTTGYYNTATGVDALALNTTGYNNTGNGVESLYSNTIGANNTAIGGNVLYNNTASDNTGVGANALYANTTGTYNIGVGLEALHFNTTGNNNTAIGIDALLSNTTGYSNVAMGNYALLNNTTDYDNIAIGDSALLNNNGAFANTAVGYASLYLNTHGVENTAMGASALDYCEGGYNTAMGTDALGVLQTGEGNTAIGAFTGGYGSCNFSTVLGYEAVAGSYQVRIGSIGGDGDPISIGGKVGWSTLSDGRVKKNIKENVPGLAFINKLQPITYNLDRDAINKIIQRPQVKDKNGKVIESVLKNDSVSKAQDQTVYTGFIAQDVEKAARSLNYDFSGVDAAKNDKDLYGLRYSDFVVPLVKGEQELSKENDSLKSIVSSLQDQINELKAMIVSSQSSTVISSASLQQNIPNPFNHTTIINYTLPQTYSSAKIIVTDNSGKTLKELSINTKGKGSLNIDASTLASGAYQYSLIVDGRLIATKQMVSAK